MKERRRELVGLAKIPLFSQILLTFWGTCVNPLANLLFKATSGCWKQLQTCFPFFSPSQMTAQLDDEQRWISWSPVLVRQMVTPWWISACVCVLLCVFPCRWLHHRRHRVLLERRRVGRDRSHADRAASVLDRRLQAGVQKRCLLHR